MTRVCLSLLCTPELEEKVIDHLLALRDDITFTQMNGASHGVHHAQQLSAEEAVLGRAASVLFQVLLDHAEALSLITYCREQFTGSGIRYWSSPVSDEGEL